MTTLAEVLNLQPAEVILSISADTVNEFGFQIVQFVILDVIKSEADLSSSSKPESVAFNTTCRCVAVESSAPYMEPLTNILHYIEVSQKVARDLTMAAIVKV